jgi:hypothetical protein
MLPKSKQTLATRRQKDRTVRDRQPKLLRATWATDQRGPRGKPSPRTDRHAAKRGPPGTAGQTKASLSLTQCESSPHPQARIPNRHDSSTEEFGACHAEHPPPCLRCSTVRLPCHEIRHDRISRCCLAMADGMLLTLDCTAPHTLRMRGELSWQPYWVSLTPYEGK